MYFINIHCYRDRSKSALPFFTFLVTIQSKGKNTRSQKKKKQHSFITAKRSKDEDGPAGSRESCSVQESSEQEELGDVVIIFFFFDEQIDAFSKLLKYRNSINLDEFLIIFWRMRKFTRKNNWFASFGDLVVCHATYEGNNFSVRFLKDLSVG